MHRNQSANQHQFAMNLPPEVKRSGWPIPSTHKTTFDAGWLIPIYVDEVLPGDSHNVNMTAFVRLSTPLYPFMDNLYCETHFFYVPDRLVWTNFVKMMGEQENPGDSTDYLKPVCSTDRGYPELSLQTYMGLPNINQIPAGNVWEHSCLFLRAYNLIWNEWFRDQNLQDRATVQKNDGPDPINLFTLLPRGKRPDYITTCLPFVQKGDSVTIPLGISAPVVPTGTPGQPHFSSIATGWFAGRLTSIGASAEAQWENGPNPSGAETMQMYWNTGTPTGLQTDLNGASAATVNQLRLAFQIQKLFERDARGGTRYNEMVWSHFRVRIPDARLQRPEYLGGGSTPISVNPVAQTSGSGTYTDTPQGNLSAFAQGIIRHGFRGSFTEHGMIIGLMSVRADLTYQQGLRKMWSRRTRFDHYHPVFQALGEQAVLNKELYITGTPTDDEVFGYNERWAEYRYKPNMITGLMNSTSAQPIDQWHLAQHFTALPTLNSQFIQEKPPLERILAVGPAAAGQQFICDAFFMNKIARLMPMYSIPGMIDHF